jgi:hypothetical protein
MTLIFGLIATYANAIEWKATNQVTIAWDATTTLIDGQPIPAGAIIKYDVYISNADTDPDKANPTKLTAEPIDALEYTLTLNTEGRYIAGVKAVRFDTAGAQVAESEVNWSDANGAMTPNPFGLIHYLAPTAPANLR